MLKSSPEVNEIERQGADAIHALLRSVPVIRVDEVKLAPPDSGVDVVVKVNLDGRGRLLVCEVKPIGQPRHVRAALLQLRKAANGFDPPATPLFIAPYLSPEAQAICREFDVGFVDLVGNARVTFDSVFIERQVDSRPPAVQRNLKSIFKPKSAQVLRVLLREPARAWRVADLAQACDVSLGHVSNVRGELVDREWAEIADDGLRLSQPDRLLDAWCEAYEPPQGERSEFYTTLHGQLLDRALRNALHCQQNAANAILASFSASHWLAPYGRVPTHYFYADGDGLTALRAELKMSPARSGANVVVTIPKDNGLFLDTVEPAPGIFCTSPVQTYLDLGMAGERGVEAADHLRQELLAWRK